MPNMLKDWWFGQMPGIFNPNARNAICKYIFIAIQNYPGIMIKNNSFVRIVKKS